MLGVQGGRKPISKRQAPTTFVDRYHAVSEAVLARCEELGGSPTTVTQDIFMHALREALPDLSLEEEDYARQMSLVVMQQVRGSGVYFADLAYLDASLRQGRVHPEEVDAAPATLSHSLFATQTQYGTKAIDLVKTTGVTWKIPRGFLHRYNAVNQEVLRAAAAAAGAQAGIAKEVVEGVWGKVTVDMFLDACRQVLGGLSPDEEEYIAALSADQVPAGAAFIRDLLYLDKCLQQGRTPTSIKGPQLLPTIFLSNTTSKGAAGLPAMCQTGGRAY